MDVDQEQSMSHNVDDHYDSVPSPSSSSIPDMNAMRGPPGSLNGEFGASSLAIPSDAPSFESQKNYETLQGTMELQFKSLQRMVQVAKSWANLASQKADSAKNDASFVKRSVQSLPHLQKMVASQTDKNLALKKELADGLKNGDLKLEEVKKKLDEQQAEILVIRQKLEELERKVESGSRSGRSSGSDNAPDNLMQMIDAFERQLGMYDVRIAEMDCRFQVLENTSYNGVLVWKIKDYARRKREAVTGRSLSLYSQPFYTSRYGYKMCACIYPNGNGLGEGSHMSLFFVVMKGDYDQHLPWPFRQKVTLCLLDQGPNFKHKTNTILPDSIFPNFGRPTSDKNFGVGFPYFIVHDDLDWSCYIKDDTIFIKLKVFAFDLNNVSGG